MESSLFFFIIELEVFFIGFDVGFSFGFDVGFGVTVTFGTAVGNIENVPFCC